MTVLGIGGSNPSESRSVKPAWWRARVGMVACLLAAGALVACGPTQAPRARRTTPPGDPGRSRLDVPEAQAGRRRGGSQRRRSGVQRSPHAGVRRVAVLALPAEGRQDDVPQLPRPARHGDGATAGADGAIASSVPRSASRWRRTCARPSSRWRPSAAATPAAASSCTGSRASRWRTSRQPPAQHRAVGRGRPRHRAAPARARAVPRGHVLPRGACNVQDREAGRDRPARTPGIGRRGVRLPPVPAHQLRPPRGGRDGDGRISLYDPADATASCANYLRHYGWRPGLSYQEQRAVIWRYNHSAADIDTVLTLSRRIDDPTPRSEGARSSGLAPAGGCARLRA